MGTKAVYNISGFYSFTTDSLLSVSTNHLHLHTVVNVVLFQLSYCHTRLHLGFSAKLRVWQVPACKMEPRSGLISCKNRPDPTRPDQTLQLSFSFNVVRCPHPNCSPHRECMCRVSPFSIHLFL